MTGREQTFDEPRVETLEDLWSWLNTWADLEKHKQEAEPMKLAPGWREGYERAICDALHQLENAGVTFADVSSENWRKWSRRWL